MDVALAEPTDSQSFTNVLAAFRGERFGFTDSASKMLWLLSRGHGVDAEITPRHFVMRFGAGRESRYSLGPAASLMTFFLERAGTIGPREIRTWIAPGVIAKIGDMPAWACPSRHVLVEAWLSRVVLRVRETEAELDDELPTMPVRRSMELFHACPHCHQVPDRYRMLSDGWLVCLACGRSSARPR